VQACTCLLARGRYSNITIVVINKRLDYDMGLHWAIHRLDLALTMISDMDVAEIAGALLAYVRLLLFAGQPALII
jgi:hypothetical protein